MQAGKLRERVTIQRPATTADPAWGPSAGWADVCEVWAEVLYGEGTERPSARSVQATGAFTVRIRYRPGINSTMRVVWGGRNLDIVGVGDPTGRRRELRIDCREHPELR